MITLTSTNPVNLATNVPTGTSVQYVITSSLSNIDKRSLITSIGGVVALNSQTFNDGVFSPVAGTGNGISGIGVLTATDPVFRNYDVGKTVTVSGSALNDGDHVITSYIDPYNVTLAGIVGPEVAGFSWILRSTMIFASVSSHLFTSSDINRYIFIENASDSLNNVESRIVEIIDAQTVRADMNSVGGSVAEPSLTWTLFGAVNGYNVTYFPTNDSALSYTVTIVPPAHLPGVSVIPVYVYSGSTGLSFSFTTGTRPQIDSINPVVGDPFGKNIRVFFTEPLLMNMDVVNPATYTISDSGTIPPSIPLVSIPAIVSVVPNSFFAVSYVDLKLSSPMTNSGQYILTVNKLGTAVLMASATGNRFDVSPNNQMSFLGFGVTSALSVYKDTLVNTPVIEGPSYISFAPTKASLHYNPPGAGGSLSFTAKNAGVLGNSITVWLKNPGVSSNPFSLSVVGNAINVLLATNSSGTVVTSLQTIITAITAATSLVDVLGSGNLNSNVVPMATALPLTGGAKLDTTTTFNFVKNSPTNPMLGSLDPDVVSILPGPSCSGVISINNFINNGDGSGSFQAVFSSLLTSYKLSVLVVDNVDNVSQESNILSISVLPETVPGLDLLIKPYKGVYAETCERLLKDIPESLFLLRDSYVVPYTYDPFSFTLKVVDVGAPVYITLTRDDFSGKPSTNLYTYIPQSLDEVISLNLGRGRNYIYATDGVRSAQILVSATTYASVLCSVAKEVYDYSRIELEEVSDSIFNDLSTRLAEPYLSLYSVLPSVKPQQLLSTKLAIRSYVSTAGQQQSVQDIVTALTLQTPVVDKNIAEKTYFEPSVLPLFYAAEAFGGVDIHTWMHNTCAARWIAFIKYLKNLPDVFRLISADDSEVVFVDDTGTTQRHQFDLLDPDCSTLDLGNFCFDNVLVSVRSHITSRINICAASYPMDLCFDSEHPLGAHGLFDSGFVWDLGLSMDDHEAYLDPGNDGWVGFCITPHWDSLPGSSAVPPRIFDPVLGTVIRNTLGDKLYGIGTNFTQYLLPGDTVYLKNENTPLTVATVNSDQEITVNPPYVAGPNPVNSGTAASITTTPPALLFHTITGLGTLDSTVLLPGTHLVLFGTGLNESVFGIIQSYLGVGSCIIETSVPVNYTVPYTAGPVNWVLGNDLPVLKKLSGIPLDSLGENPENKGLGSVYILDKTMEVQQATLPEVPFYVDGIGTHFTSDLEVGYTVYFPDERDTTYLVLSIESDTRILVQKNYPVNTVTPPLITPPHSRVLPLATSSNDATLTRISPTVADFTAPQTIFTVASIGSYINIPAKSGFGLSLDSGTGVLEVDTPTLLASDFVVGSTITISGAITPGNNGVKTVVSFIDATHVQISGIVLNESSNFLWKINDNSSTSNRRLGRIIGLNGSAPTNSVQLSTVNGGEWLAGTEANTFDWELLPSPLSLVLKVLPTCAYENGYAVTLATLTSTDIDLSEHSSINAIAFSISYTEDVLITNIDANSAQITINGANTGHRPYFLSTDVDMFLTVNAIGPHKIIQVIDSTNVVVDAGLASVALIGATWYLQNT